MQHPTGPIGGLLLRQLRAGVGARPWPMGAGGVRRPPFQGGASGSSGALEGESQRGGGVEPERVPPCRQRFLGGAKPVCGHVGAGKAVGGHAKAPAKSPIEARAEEAAEHFEVFFAPVDSLRDQRGRNSQKQALAAMEATIMGALGGGEKETLAAFMGGV